MNVIIPMAGMGKRLRPHTLSTPKPLLHIACKPIVHHLCEDIAKVVNKKINNISFIIGPNFGNDVQAMLCNVASDLGANGLIRIQHEALGTAHAVWQAETELNGEVIVAFADTLFQADFKLDTSVDGTIWVKEIEDPSQFGVVKTDAHGVITDFIEKPSTFISNKAIIGIYHFANAENLRDEIKYLLDNDIKEKGEYQLTNCLENMKNKGMKFATASVNEWMDCGNKRALVETNSKVLEIKYPNGYIDPSSQVTNSEIIQPCYIGDNVVINEARVGPGVSIGSKSVISKTSIANTIIGTNTQISHCQLSESVIGSHCTWNGEATSVSLGDYSEFNN